MTDAHHATDWLPGGGEMGALIRAHDWSATPLGPVEQWPQSLKTSLGIMLNSRYPMFVFWGPHLITIYNDGYRPITGEKHPWALGRPAPEVWPEIWSDIQPLVSRALAGDPTWSDDLMLFMKRRGFHEEVYFTFSYSPIPDEAGGVAGMLCACTETTGKVLGERRLGTLRDLAARPAGARTVDEACTLSAEVLERNPSDVPFALVYLLEDGGAVAELKASAGVKAGEPVSPLLVARDTVTGWPLFRVADDRKAEDVLDLRSRFASVPAGPWPEPPSAAVVLPIVDRGLDRAAGVVVLGISARRVFDDEYRGWFELVASQLGASIANARAEEEERKRAEALAELDRAKTAFFGNVSHELRTPLTLMLGPLEKLLAECQGAAPAIVEDLTLVHRNGLRLLRLVNTLLDFSRIEAGRLQAAYEPTELATFTGELASAFRSAIERAGLRLHVDCPPLPEPVYVDRDMWEKIVLNLLSNAFKFTLEGTITVTLRGRGDTVELAVADTGTGIPGEEVPHLFERFYRVKGARGRSLEGTGIGLAMVQELVRLHGGSVGVESVPGRGSTFTVSIPTGTAHLPAERIGAFRSPGAPSLGAAPFVEEALRWLPDDEQTAAMRGAESLTGTAAHPRQRILWVDDNADMRAYVRRLLREHWDVEAVADGETALAAARARVPDLVLADVMMPGLDGFALLRALRDDPLTRAVPVILLSARAGEEARVEGLQAGADDYVVKPFTARELIARISTHLALARMRQDAARQAQEARVEAEAASRAKDVFLATLSHELRQPMSSMVAWVRMLGRPDLSAEARARGFESLDRNIHALTRLIDDLLDVSSIAAGKVRLVPRTIDVRQPIEAALEVGRAAAAAKDITLDASLDPVPPILADPDRLRQVVSNLVSNAVKFTPNGGRVSVRLRATAARIIIEVADSGRGIKPEFLPRIFDRFSQFTDGASPASGGLGLGLAIVRHLVEMHGGTVAADSPGEGRGSTFTVTLPVTTPHGVV